MCADSRENDGATRLPSTLGLYYMHKHKLTGGWWPDVGQLDGSSFDKMLLFSGDAHLCGSGETHVAVTQRKCSGGGGCDV